jgi:hypothetical protein
MTVYVLVEHWDWEGDDVIGVYSTEQLASQAASERENDDLLYNSRATYQVKEWEVHEPIRT